MATKPTINQNLTTVNRTSGNSGRKWIVIYNVGTAATAEGAAYNNTVYFKSTYRGASAHYFVDKGSIWQCVSLDDTAWHCGTTGTYYSECRNSTSIGIELCGNSTFPDAEIKLAAKLVQWLMDKYDIDADHVIRHYDVTHKSCPAAYLTDSKWSALKATLVGSSSSSSSSSSTSSSTSVNYKVKVTASSGLNVRKGAGTSYAKVTAIPYGKTVTITKKSSNWGYTTYNSKSGWICLDYTSKVSSSSSSSSSSSVSYTVGKTYTTKVDALRVRKGAGTSYAVKTYSQLTSNAQANAYSNGTLKKGTKVTCKATKTVDGDVWMKIPSGWIAAYYNGSYYVK